MPKYEFLDHTADICLKVTAGTLPELFVTAAHGIFSVITSRSQREVFAKTELILQAQTIEDLLVAWLNELIAQVYTYNICYLDANILIEPENHHFGLRAQLKTVKINPADIAREIKAATYHGLEIKQDGQGYNAEIIFDV